MTGLALLFFGVALLYASIGFGGGSTYTALLVLSGTDYRAIPVISLLCNIVVVSLGTWRFWRDGFVQWRRIWPFFALSVPMAWLGGRMVVGEQFFIGALALVLFVSGLALFFQRELVRDDDKIPKPCLVEPVLGGALGFLAGFTGTGGGIFLAPALHFLRWDRSKVIAGTCAAFILVNSLAGLLGQITKNDGYDRLETVAQYWVLFPAVALGGFAGSFLGSSILDPRYVRMGTAALILFVSANLGLSFKEMLGGLL